MANKKNPKVRDMKPTKDAKGGGGGQWSGVKSQGAGPIHTQSGGGPAHTQSGHGPHNES